MITAFSIGCFANLGKMVTMVTIIQKVEEAWNLAPQKLYSLLYITDMIHINYWAVLKLFLQPSINTA